MVTRAGDLATGDLNEASDLFLSRPAGTGLELLSRPRAGLLRGREFVMKDSYSFDATDAGLLASYAMHRDAYIRIFDRLGFDYVIVKATSGAMGGSGSEEFLARADVGEDSLIVSSSILLVEGIEFWG